MAVLTAYVLRLIAVVGEILGIVQVIQGIAATLATAQQVTDIAAEVKDIQLKVNDSVIGLAALRDQLDLIYTQEVASFGTIEAALALVPKTGDTYPYSGDVSSGGSNMTSDAIATAVWVYRGPTTDDNAIDLLEDAAVPNIMQANWLQSVASYQDAVWEYLPDTNIDHSPSGSNGLPTFDFSTIIGADATAVDWLNRLAGAPVYSDFGGGVPGFFSDNGAVFYAPKLNQGAFASMKQGLGLTATNVTPPVWPGLAGVILGDPVDISLSFTVDGPMDGIIVAIATYPTLKGQYTYDDMISALKIGAIAFVSDNGDAEFIQGLGFLNEVYCPKSMTHATSCKVRTVSGITGTITPWSLA